MAADAVTERLALLEQRPAVERAVAAELRTIVVTLTEAGLVAERREAQVFAERLERMASRIDKWASADEKRYRRLRKGIRRSGSSSRDTRAAVAAVRDALGGELI